MGTNDAFKIATTFGSESVVSSKTWHQWHHTAARLRKSGLCAALASSNAAGPNARHWISAAWFGRGEKRSTVGGGARCDAARISAMARAFDTASS